MGVDRAVEVVVRLGRRGGRRGAGRGAAVGRAGRPPAPDVDQGPEDHHDHHDHRDGAPPPRPSVHGGQSVALYPVTAGTRDGHIGQVLVVEDERSARVGEGHRAPPPGRRVPTTEACAGGLIGLRPRSPGRARRLRRPGRPREAPTMRMGADPVRSVTCSMVPRAEWYRSTEERSPPSGRRRTTTATRATITTTPAATRSHITPIQPEESAPRAAWSQVGRRTPADRSSAGGVGGQVRSPARGRRAGSRAERRGLDWSRSDRTGSVRPQSAPMAGSSQATPSSSFGL